MPSILTHASGVDPASAPFSLVPALLAGALVRRGFNALTPVQEAVLDPTLAGQDLRISSQTGSGKTVALGFVIAPDLAIEAKKPAAIIIAPTRELAAQLALELTWLLEPLGAKVCAVTGGTSVQGEHRALRQDPRVIVGTPGRLLDHLERGAIDASMVRAVVLDEADQMLDLGFRETLQSILAKLPAEKRTHLVSATFSREVRSLADRYQKNARMIEGTTLGDANQDIVHIAHIVRASDRDAAIRNLLLMTPGERTLVFVRTRIEASDLADRLCAVGFTTRALSGELEQRERTKRLDAFRSGAVKTLIATDVAARGIDVPDVTRVIHADPPSDSEVLTHRSGRTGRAGNKGVSIVLAPPAARERVTQMFRRARVQASWKPAPTPADVLAAADKRLKLELSAERTTPPDARLTALAADLLASMDPTLLVATLLESAGHAGPCEPLPIAPVEALPARRAFAPPVPYSSHAPLANTHAPHASTRPQAGPRAYSKAPPQGARPYNNAPPQGARPYNNAPPQGARPFNNAPPQGPRPFNNAPPARMANAAPIPRARLGKEGDAPSTFVPFRVNWGANNGADPRRLLALLCRRGGVNSKQIGAIRIGPVASTFEVCSVSAPEFAKAAQRPDARDPRVRIAMGAA